MTDASPEAVWILFVRSDWRFFKRMRDRTEARFFSTWETSYPSLTHMWERTAPKVLPL